MLQIFIFLSSCYQSQLSNLCSCIFSLHFMGTTCKFFLITSIILVSFSLFIVGEIKFPLINIQENQMNCISYSIYPDFFSFLEILLKCRDWSLPVGAINSVNTQWIFLCFSGKKLRNQSSHRIQSRVCFGILNRLNFFAGWLDLRGYYSKLDLLAISSYILLFLMYFEFENMGRIPVINDK